MSWRRVLTTQRNGLPLLRQASGPETQSGCATKPSAVKGWQISNAPARYPGMIGQCGRREIQPTTDAVPET